MWGGGYLKIIIKDKNPTGWIENLEILSNRIALLTIS